MKRPGDLNSYAIEQDDPPDPPRCDCGRPAVCKMEMTTPQCEWIVGDWWLCEKHALAALRAAKLETNSLDFDDRPSEAFKE